ncbi:Ankyrin repeat-containing protein [Quillaja saponaria]|uniref:Ankyrin repeat-containing protein n=1 Tax=Quillaja saponaria TaxID=32244 RepID=A0AAD7PIB8_QUISA|nr:Ankyrin repeat-containing protein [Quillaja saponaria]
MTSFQDVQAAATEFARGFNHNYYRPLQVAALKGDWETAKKFFNNDPTATTAKVTTLAMTALHVGAIGGQWQFVEKMAQHMPKEALAVQDLAGCTALHYVAMGGNTKAAKALVTKNPSLTQITNLAGLSPLIYAITSTNCKDLVWYLTLVTTDENPGFPFSGSSAGYLVALLTAAGFHDITLYLLQQHHNLAIVTDDNGSYILNVLSKMPAEFPSGSKLGFFERCIYQFVPVDLDHSPLSNLTDINQPELQSKTYMAQGFQSYFGSLRWKGIERLVPGIKEVRDRKLRHKSAVRLVDYVCSKALTRNSAEFWQSFVSANILRNATSSGIVEILRICFDYFPDLIWNYIPNEGYIVHVAIKSRQEKVFSLICNMPICKNFILVVDESENTTSHLAANLAPSAQLADISGSALQMQKELQWFKEVEKLDHPLHREVKNKNGKTAWELFKEEHKDLLERGEKWMKDTSNSCMLVATLIATVVFAAAFTVPGGNNSDKGIPIFLNDNAFMVFAISDALALFSSITSLWMFLSILTASYAEEDFLKRLPQRLILGLAFLFFAIATTMIAFGATLSIVLRDRFQWVYIPITLLASLPVTLFAMLQLPLFIQMIRSTYGTSIYHPQSLW